MKADKFNLPHHPLVVAAGRGGKVEYSTIPDNSEMPTCKFRLFVDDGMNKSGDLTANDKNFLALQRAVNLLFSVANTVNQNTDMDAREAILNLRATVDHDLYMVRSRIDEIECYWVEVPMSCDSVEIRNVGLFETERQMKINALTARDNAE